MNNFILMVEYLDGSVVLASLGKKDSYLLATEENKQYLIEIGNKLLDDNLIKSYQLATLYGPPVFKL
jgi:hypothetical protein